MVIYERTIAFDNDLDITAPLLSVTADKQRTVAATMCFNANDNATTSKQDQARPSRRPSEPLPVGAPAPSRSSHDSQPEPGHLNQWSDFSPRLRWA